MTDIILMDNDVALKACCYDVIDELADCLVGSTRKLHILGAARYVLQRAIAKGKNVVNKDQASQRLTQFLASVTEVEPDGKELELAAKFEEAALKVSDAALHGGESQLLAILIVRMCLLLMTGDKRAIRAVEPVLEACGHIESAVQRIACLEQIMTAMVGRHGAESLQTRICSESGVDITMAICFRCTSGSFTSESVVESLASYIRDLRRVASRILVEADDLSTMITQEDGVG